MHRSAGLVVAMALAAWGAVHPRMALAEESSGPTPSWQACVDPASSPDARIAAKDGAIADFRKALELRPDLGTARAGLTRLGATP